MCSHLCGGVAAPFDRRGDAVEYACPERGDADAQLDLETWPNESREIGVGILLIVETVVILQLEGHRTRL